MPTEGFSEAEWLQLRRILEAGTREDVETFKAELHRLDRVFPMSGRAGAYLWYSLRYQVGDRLGRRPTEEDLHKIATEVYSQFRVLVVSDLDVLVELLRVVFEFQRPTNRTSGSLIIVNGAAALSALVGGPGDLDGIKPHLERWYDKCKDAFQALDPLGS